MSDIYLTNTLTRKKEKFVSIDPPNVGLYSCGPTVYLSSHIGHMRSYVGVDILKRILKLNGYQVKHVMNITDVGHLTSDNDTGEDKVEKTARETGKSAWDIAKFYTDQFFSFTDSLNIERPDVVCKATDHIGEQIDLIKKLEEKGFTYKTSDGIYFDTSKLSDYGKLTGGKEGIKAGARVEMAEKKNPTDFALWKFSYSQGRSFDSAQDDSSNRRQMEWESPWGKGFPGWHIECSAMSMKYLGETFDIHTGGIDHIPVHHTNEIAQSETATGKPFVKYGIHFEFLMVDGKKMSKSLGNIYTVDEVREKGFDPISLRYLYLTAHYRDPLNFTWESLESAQNALENLRKILTGLKSQLRTQLSEEKNEKLEKYRSDFLEAVNDDLNTPKALAVLWEMVKSNIPSPDKYDLAMNFDEVFGLGLSKTQKLQEAKTPNNIKVLIEKREKLRKEGKFEESDEVRKKIESKGYKVEDTDSGPKIRKD